MSLIKLGKQDKLKIDTGEYVRLASINLTEHTVEVYAHNNPLLSWTGSDRDRTFDMFDYAYYVQSVAGLYSFVRKLKSMFARGVNETQELTMVKLAHAKKKETARLVRNAGREFARRWRNN